MITIDGVKQIMTQDRLYLVDDLDIKKITIEFITDFYNKKHFEVVKAHLIYVNPDKANDANVNNIFEIDLIYYVYIMFFHKHQVRFRFLLVPQSNDICRLFNLLKIDINE